MSTSPTSRVGLVDIGHPTEAQVELRVIHPSHDLRTLAAAAVGSLPAASKPPVLRGGFLTHAWRTLGVPERRL